MNRFTSALQCAGYLRRVAHFFTVAVVLPVAGFGDETTANIVVSCVDWS